MYHSNGFSFGPPGWQDIKENPNSIWTKMSNGLGDGIDTIAGFLEETAVSLSSVPFMLMALVILFFAKPKRND